MSGEQKKRTVSQSIAMGEAVVGAALQKDLSEFLDLAQEVTDFAGELIADVGTITGDQLTIKVRGVILARIITDLQACAHLIRAGYAGQAVSLSAGMMEQMYVASYIWTDSQRADEWVSWDVTTGAYPKIKMEQLIALVAERLSLQTGVAKREYHTLYRDACMVKHGNTLIMATLQIHSTEEATFLLIGPNRSREYAEMACVGIQRAVRYSLAAACAFAVDMLPAEHAASLHSEMDRLSDRMNELGKLALVRDPEAREI